MNKSERPRIRTRLAAWVAQALSLSVCGVAGLLELAGVRDQDLAFGG